MTPREHLQLIANFNEADGLNDQQLALRELDKLLEDMVSAVNASNDSLRHQKWWEDWAARAKQAGY
jgi:hypothetical protein